MERTASLRPAPTAHPVKEVSTVGSELEAQKAVRAATAPAGGWAKIEPNWRNLSWKARHEVVEKYLNEQRRQDERKQRAKELRLARKLAAEEEEAKKRPADGGESARLEKPKSGLLKRLSADAAARLSRSPRSFRPDTSTRSTGSAGATAPRGSSQNTNSGASSPTWTSSASATPVKSYSNRPADGERSEPLTPPTPSKRVSFGDFPSSTSRDGAPTEDQRGQAQADPNELPVGEAVQDLDKTGANTDGSDGGKTSSKAVGANSDTATADDRALMEIYASSKETDLAGKAESEGRSRAMDELLDTGGLHGRGLFSRAVTEACWQHIRSGDRFYRATLTLWFLTVMLSLVSCILAFASTTRPGDAAARAVAALTTAAALSLGVWVVFGVMPVDLGRGPSAAADQDSSVPTKRVVIMTDETAEPTDESPRCLPSEISESSFLEGTTGAAMTVTMEIDAPFDDIMEWRRDSERRSTRFLDRLVLQVPDEQALNDGKVATKRVGSDGARRNSKEYATAEVLKPSWGRRGSKDLLGAGDVSKFAARKTGSGELYGSGEGRKPKGGTIDLYGSSTGWGSDTHAAPDHRAEEAGDDGRARLSFQSKCVRTQSEWQRDRLREQGEQLERQAKEIKELSSKLRLKESVREEEKELLRGFRKIVTREFEAPTDKSAASRVAIFIMDEREDLRADLYDICMMLDYECFAFSDVETGMDALRKAVQKETDVAEPTKARGKWMAAVSAVRPGALSGARFGSAVMNAVKVARETKRLARVVFLGASILYKLPPEWDAFEGLFGALTSEPEDFEDVGQFLMASELPELRQKLKDWGITEYLMHPISLETVRVVVSEAIKRHFSDEFLLLKQLGRGGSGIVYRTKRLRDGAIFALKEMNTRRLKTKAALEEVKSEASLLQELKWPTILYSVDAWASPGDQLFYVLMPLLEGGTLGQSLEGADSRATTPRSNSTPASGGATLPSVGQVAEWYMQTLHGIVYLHWRGILHRDIKPGNLMLGSQGRALRIGDFGSAVRLPGPGPHPARRMSVHGKVTTPAYSSPEVRSQKLYYPGSDLWSLGATYYEALTLRRLGADPSSPTLSDVVGDVCQSVSADRLAGGGGLLPIIGRDAPTFVEKFAGEVSELLRPNPFDRPMAARIAGRTGSVAQNLPTVLSDVGAFTDPALRDAHLKEFQRMLAESDAIVDVEPDGSAIHATRAGAVSAQIAL